MMQASSLRGSGSSARRRSSATSSASIVIYVGQDKPLLTDAVRYLEAAAEVDDAQLNHEPRLASLLLVCTTQL